MLPETQALIAIFIIAAIAAIVTGARVKKEIERNKHEHHCDCECNCGDCDCEKE